MFPQPGAGGAPPSGANGPYGYLNGRDLHALTMRAGCVGGVYCSFRTMLTDRDRSSVPSTGHIRLNGRPGGRRFRRNGQQQQLGGMQQQQMSGSGSGSSEGQQQMGGSGMMQQMDGSGGSEQQQMGPGGMQQQMGSGGGQQQMSGPGGQQQQQAAAKAGKASSNPMLGQRELHEIVARAVARRYVASCCILHPSLTHHVRITVCMNWIRCATFGFSVGSER